MPSKPPEAYPVAMIPYINMLPYRMLGIPPGCCWHQLVPRESVSALATGRVLAAAVPVGALPGLSALVEPLGQYGIAAREASMSVLFFSDKPFDQISVRDSMRITPESATSVRLLHLLLKRRDPSNGIPRLRKAAREVGELVIGDQALKAMQAWRRDSNEGRPSVRNRGFTHVTDLATRWHQLYRLPFVFARWVVRRDAPPEARAILLEWLEAFRTREAVLVSQSIPIAARRLGLSEGCLEDYYRCLGRVLDEADLAGQSLFLRALRRSPFDDAGRAGARENGATCRSYAGLSGNPHAAPTGLSRDWGAGSRP